MPCYRISYTFKSLFEGHAATIRAAVRELAHSEAFDPSDLNDWRVSRTEDGDYRLEARRTLVTEIAETSERAAFRKFLYSTDLPDKIDPTAITIERLEDEPNV